MKYQFDSCSYEELTSCVRTRIGWIRECRRFLADPSTRGYHHIRMQTALSKTSMMWEIEKLLKMRRILKKSVTRNWNTDYFVRRGKWPEHE